MFAESRNVQGGVYYVSATTNIHTATVDGQTDSAAAKKVADTSSVTVRSSPLSTPPTPTVPRTTPIHNVFVRTLEHIFDRLDTIDRQAGGGIVDRRIVVYRRHNLAADTSPPNRLSVQEEANGDDGVRTYNRLNNRLNNRLRVFLPHPRTRSCCE